MNRQFIAKELVKVAKDLVGKMVSISVKQLIDYGKGDEQMQLEIMSKLDGWNKKLPKKAKKIVDDMMFLDGRKQLSQAKESGKNLMRCCGIIPDAENYYALFNYARAVKAHEASYFFIERAYDYLENSSNHKSILDTYKKRFARSKVSKDLVSGREYKFESKGSLHRNVLLETLEDMGIKYNEYETSTSGITPLTSKAKKIIDKLFKNKKAKNLVATRYNHPVEKKAKQLSRLHKRLEPVVKRLSKLDNFSYNDEEKVHALYDKLMDISNEISRIEM